MGLYGTLFKGAGKLAGGTAKVLLNATGYIVGEIADSRGNYSLGNNARRIGSELGNTMKDVGEWTGNAAGQAIDTAFMVVAQTGGVAGAGIATIAGKDMQTVEKARKIGAIATGIGAGLMVGDVAGSALTGMAIAHGAASTGTAISAIHGAAQSNAALALLGGGAQIIGGGGMEVGTAVLNGINAISAVDGGLQGNTAIKTKTNMPLLPNSNSK